MNNNIQKILQELYEIDSSLKDHEGQLQEVIQKMMEVKPNIQADSHFKNELQSQIQQKILQKKIQKLGNKKLSFFQLFSYVFGTIGMACFGFIVLRENVLDQANFSPKRVEAPSVESQEVSPESLSKMTKKSLVEPSQKNDENSKNERQQPNVTEDTDTTITQTEEKSIATEEKINGESLPQDAVGLNENMGIAADQAPGSMGLMKEAPMMAEYIQDVYIYSFSGAFDLDIKQGFETFKKLSSNTSSFSLTSLPLETSPENILKVALAGGKDGMIDMPQSEKKREIHVTLKNPKIAYSNVYHFVNGVSKEYFAPCVIFEVEKSDDPNFYQTEIVVPLVKEIYKYDENGMIIGLSQE